MLMKNVHFIFLISLSVQQQMEELPFKLWFRFNFQYAKRVTGKKCIERFYFEFPNFNFNFFCA